MIGLIIFLIIYIASLWACIWFTKQDLIRRGKRTTIENIVDEMSDGIIFLIVPIINTLIVLCLGVCYLYTKFKDVEI